MNEFKTSHCKKNNLTDVYIHITNAQNSETDVELRGD